MIDNFILMIYGSNLRYQYYLAVAIRRIRQFYPKSKIHILTDMNFPQVKSDGVMYHQRHLEGDLIKKFWLWDLINAPAMYLDLDVYMHRPFEPRHLDTPASFAVYKHFNYDLSPMSQKPFPHPVLKQYNSGVIWIRKPSQEIGHALRVIHERYFSDKNWSDSHPIQNYAWANDEYPLSFLIETHHLVMPCFEEVNQFSFRKVANPQTVHFVGKQGKIAFDQYLSCKLI